jgi:hypothetical protein
VADQMSIEDVLREMDEVANANLEPTFRTASPARIARWLEVLRPALAHRGEELYERWNREERQEPDREVLPLASGLRQELLRDLHVGVQLSVDHEGGGEIQLMYQQTPPGHRLQALIQLMGAIGTRVELAIGSEAYTRMLRGIVIERTGR